jgi:hypothetical protein
MIGDVKMKDINGYEGLYAVDQNGNVWSYRKNDWLKPVTNKYGCHNQYGYHKVNLSKDGKMKSHKVHRLVAQAYLENYSEDLEVDHINGDKLNNKLENLRMVSHQQNMFNQTKAKGYYWRKDIEKWMAYITVNYRKKNLGYFDTEAEARDTYIKAKEIYHII